MIIKLDSTSNVKWSETFGGGAEGANSIVQNSNGELVTTGYTYLFSAGSTGNIYMTKVDSDGNLKKIESIGPYAEEFGNSLTVTKDGGYALAGKTCCYSGGVYILKLDSGLGTCVLTSTGGALTR